MRVVAVVQARMGSTRLPGKSMMELCGKPMVGHVLDRLKQARLVSDVVLAPPLGGDNEVLWDVARDAGVGCWFYRGPEEDLIGRHWGVAQAFEADVVVRVPGDNPCVDPDEVDAAVGLFCRVSGADPNVLVSNLEQTPKGLGAEVYHPLFLQGLDLNVHHSLLREHPHLWAYAHERVMSPTRHYSLCRRNYRFDVNTRADFDFIKGIYDALYPTNPDFRTRDILRFLDGDRHDS